MSLNDTYHRSRAHKVRVMYRHANWYTLAHRHRRRMWRRTLKHLVGSVMT